MLSPRQLLLIVKVQARFRGILTRKKLRTYPAFSNLFDRMHHNSRDKHKDYHSDKVASLLEQMGDFEYGKQPRPGKSSGSSSENQNLDYRPEVTMENKSKYEGQWVTGT